ncbi:hypothetical protein LTS07_007613 [Exophiala sideris]|uniref:F-box domain-containing protein n=1 Tax=Exophiala sideris TaxID=1016849 RepID=A0ABR0JA48_9EURO|nr:hypothetical protein LTS07_007613 [Exophiala sideris]KAK5032343.1 hypothetical protein LTR13_007166 [Exophiala sideris]KAK5059498.1 hypothetical protein LTR69_006087 [Exophiala sideris]KAK5186661.1 hypothetical protein LTR44_000667 [Eurotiomycetes sp. CCFEE 6388]
MFNPMGEIFLDRPFPATQASLQPPYYSVYAYRELCQERASCQSIDSISYKSSRSPAAFHYEKPATQFRISHNWLCLSKDDLQQMVCPYHDRDESLPASYPFDCGCIPLCEPTARQNKSSYRNLPYDKLAGVSSKAFTNRQGRQRAERFKCPSSPDMNTEYYGFQANEAPDAQDTCPRSAQAPHGKINLMDGASDSPDATPPPARSRASSHSIARPKTARLWRVRFLSVEDLRSRQSSISQADESTFEREDSQFTNPFGYDQTSLSSRHSSSSDATAYLRPNAFAGHRDTLARLVRPVTFPDKYNHGHIETLDSAFGSSSSNQPPLHLSASRKSSSAHGDVYLPLPIVDAVLDYLSFEDYKALRSVCRQWHVSLPLPHFPAVFRLPGEILQHIYSYLSLCDFDAARHTCRSWLLASLDKNVQDPLLRSSGCQSALTADIQWLTESDDQGRDMSRQSSLFENENQVMVDKDWICSKRLATESRLSPEWRGSSLSHVSGSLPRLWLMEEVDFSKIISQDVPSGRARFTVSTCGKFVLVVSQTDISLYSLCEPGQSVTPIIRLAAGLEVLKVSMDTSSERFSVAALLAGRLGMLWDLLGSPLQTRYRNSSGEPLSLGLQTYVQASATFSPRGPRSSDWSIDDEELLATEAPPYSATPPAILSESSSPGFVPSPPTL